MEEDLVFRVELKEDGLVKAMSEFSSRGFIVHVNEDGLHIQAPLRIYEKQLGYSSGQVEIPTWAEDYVKSIREI